MTEKKEKPIKLQPADTIKPNHPCRNCGTDNWWQRYDGAWLCGICQPKPME